MLIIRCQWNNPKAVGPLDGPCANQGISVGRPDGAMDEAVGGIGQCGDLADDIAIGADGINIRQPLGQIRIIEVGEREVGAIRRPGRPMGGGGGENLVGNAAFHTGINATQARAGIEIRDPAIHGINSGGHGIAILRQREDRGGIAEAHGPEIAAGIQDQIRRAG